MSDRKADSWGYLIVWEFRPQAGADLAFTTAYGPQGVWAKFFAKGQGFVATDLNQDLRDSSRYLTLDFWVSKNAYEAFLEAHQSEYNAIDRQCEDLTAEERFIGTFERL